MPQSGLLIEPWAFILGREMADVFAVEDWQVLNGTVRYRGRLLVEPEVAMSLLAPRIEPMGFVPMIHNREEIVLIRLPAAARRALSGWKGWPLNLALLIATLGTTLFAGAVMEGADPLSQPLALLKGVPFSASQLLILGCHELGHYFTARAYGVQVSLPYFIPLPLPPMGTMGAIIKMRSPIPSRKVLFDIGIAGPLAGLVLSIPILAIGLHFSSVKAVSGLAAQEGVFSLGDSLASSFLQWLVIGPISSGYDVFLHPMALAGWLGFFVTALNLMPLSQLDGGHLVYAVMGQRYRSVVWAFMGVLVILFMVSRWPGWLIWVALSVGLGLKHPPPLDDLTPLDPLRRWLALLALGLLVALLPPLPFAM
jgi:membrane-associated protease RseP (regulator of RpoE activity)